MSLIYRFYYIYRFCFSPITGFVIIKYKKMYLLSFNKLQKVHPLFVFFIIFLVFYSLWEVEHYFRAGSRGAFDLHRVLLSII